MGIENKTKEINTPEQLQQKELSSKQEKTTHFEKDFDHDNSISKPEAKTTASKTDIPNKKPPEKSTLSNRDVKPAEVKPPERKAAPPTDIKQERINQKATLDANRTIDSLSYKEIHKMLETPEGRAELTKMNADFREGYEAEIRGMSREEYRDFKEKIQSESAEQQESDIDKNAEKTDVTDKNGSDNGDGPNSPHNELYTKLEVKKNGLNEKETAAVKEITEPHFDRAREITQIATKETPNGFEKDNVGKNFTDHNEKHVEQVKEKTTEVLDVSVEAIKSGKMEREGANSTEKDGLVKEASFTSKTENASLDVVQDYISQRNKEAEAYLNRNFGEEYIQLSEYRNGRYESNDFDTYSQDPEWQKLSNEYLVQIGEKPIKYVFDDFEKSVLDTKPHFFDGGSFYEQGINQFGYLGTCGPTTQANTLNKLLNVNEFTENKVLSIAIDNNLCETKALLPTGLGGTTTEKFVDLYDKIKEITGAPINVEVFDYENALTVDEMADKLESGSILNVAVDSATLWGECVEVTLGETTPTDHWITVTDVIKSYDGEIVGFKLIDSGSAVDYANTKRFEQMCFGTLDRKMSDPTCVVVSKKDVANEL